MIPSLSEVELYCKDIAAFPAVAYICLQMGGRNIAIDVEKLFVKACYFHGTHSVWICLYDIRMTKLNLFCRSLELCVVSRY